jgi:hypothetical protein
MRANLLAELAACPQLGLGHIGGDYQDLLDRHDEARLVVEKTERAWSMDADGSLFRLVSEAKRISLAHLFDPFLAVQASTLRTLPHQIDAVYNKMLPRQPLRFLLADDPGAGKTIMAGLFCKELMIRGDVERGLPFDASSVTLHWQPYFDRSEVPARLRSGSARPARRTSWREMTSCAGSWPSFPWPGVARLQQLPGVGPQTATQVVAAASQLGHAMMQRVRPRFDPDARPPLQTRLLAELCSYAVARQAAAAPPRSPATPDDPPAAAPAYPAACRA